MTYQFIKNILVHSDNDIKSIKNYHSNIFCLVLRNINPIFFFHNFYCIFFGHSSKICIYTCTIQAKIIGQKFGSQSYRHWTSASILLTYKKNAQNSFFSRLYPKLLNFSTTACKSSGSGASQDRRSLVRGWVISKRQAWSNWRCTRGLSPLSFGAPARRLTPPP